MTENAIYYYQRDGKEFSTVSLNVAIIRRDIESSIYVQYENTSEKILINLK